MKKSLLILGFALTLFSCNKETQAAKTSEFKTAYVNIQILSDSLQEFKDLESQSKVKMEEMGRDLDARVQQFKLEAASFENEAKAKGPQWAQLKGQELQKREQELGMMQQAMTRQLQDEFRPKNDSVTSKMKRFIKDYGKKNGYDYIYATADISSILYAKEGYNITDKILKELNDTYKGGSKTEDSASNTAKEENKK
ncbi:OmpH family outer membrane protein [Flavobacterium sp. DGU11]|uniref:OmpH family outer membrane protein n=1 Tax=Flavobacterium arundinis TaxID=3139143 RepID=A0ABU9I0W7_9FLAO